MNRSQTPRRLAGVLYTYLFLDDLVLLYPVYTLLFSDSGLSVWQISSLFVLWSVASILFEVPSGAFADATSRRRLLVVGPLLTAVASGSWVASPSYTVFALGFLLWGLKTALTSGAFAVLALPYVGISLWLLATRGLTSSVVQGGGSST